MRVSLADDYASGHHQKERAQFFSSQSVPLIFRITRMDPCTCLQVEKESHNTRNGDTEKDS